MEFFNAAFYQLLVGIFRAVASFFNLSPFFCFFLQKSLKKCELLHNNTGEQRNLQQRQWHFCVHFYANENVFFVFSFHRIVTNYTKKAAINKSRILRNTEENEIVGFYKRGDCYPYAKKRKLLPPSFGSGRSPSFATCLSVKSQGKPKLGEQLWESIQRNSKQHVSFRTQMRQKWKKFSRERKKQQSQMCYLPWRKIFFFLSRPKILLTWTSPT